ncbi:MAG TPA: YSC84-related protein [Caldimonas sp.]|nr:YSC84-related protein [Caldimonas sp.]
MSRKLLVTAAASAAIALLGITGCVTNTSPGFAAGEKPATMEDGVATTLNALYASAPGSKDLAATAKGVLVFPRVASGGLVVGGEHGHGALLVNGQIVGKYKISSISLGLQAGLQSQSLVLMFMSQEALDRFQAKDGWTAGSDASVAVGRVGANGRLETFNDTGVVAFALTNAGLMAGANVNGTYIAKEAS